MASADFQAMVLSDFLVMIDDIGVNVTLNRFTATSSNITGDEDIVGGFGSNITIKAIFNLNKRTYDYETEGEVEQGDATLFSKPSDSVQRNDKITYDSKTYIVIDKTKRENVDKCTLELWTR